jgi:hypothetical protein
MVETVPGVWLRCLVLGKREKTMESIKERVDYMIKRRQVLYPALLLFVLLLVGCGTDTNGEVEGEEETEKDTAEETIDENNGIEESDLKEKEDEPQSESKSEDTASNNFSDTSSEQPESKESTHTEQTGEINILSEYSSAEIEYARVWLELGPNQELDELNVRHISAGEPINPNDETSLSYPEDVIQLAGSRLVDGSVLYSGNGDGTVNVYHVPLRWDGEYPAGEEFYQEIIDNTKLESISPGNDEEVLELINLLNIQP